MNQSMTKDFEKFAKYNYGIGDIGMLQYQKMQGDLAMANVPNYQSVCGGVTDFQNVRTPYILEERQMRATQMDVFSRLMMERIIWCSGPVDQNMSDILSAQLMYLSSNSDNKDINIYVNSPGGSVYAGLTIIDTMDLIKSGALGEDRKCDIATTNIGMAASMGSVLLAKGTKGKRFALPNSRTMLHQSSGGFNGNIQDAEKSMQEWKRLNDTLAGMLVDCSNMKDIAEYKSKTVNDYWLLAEDALKEGLIDKIINA